MKKRFFYRVVIFPFLLFFTFFITNSCNKNLEKPPLTKEYKYIYYMRNDIVKQIWRMDYMGRIDKTVYDTINDSVLVTYIYDSYNKLNQKKYYFLNTKGLAYRSVDTVADEKIICSYTYQYNDDTFLIKLDYKGAQYSDDFKTVQTTIEGYNTYSISNNNITSIYMYKKFTGSLNLIKEVTYENIFNDLPNTKYIQQGWEYFIGKSNANLLHKIMYTYKENNTIKEAGTFDYTYILDDSTQLIKKQTEIHNSKKSDKIPVQTILQYEYK